MIKTCLLPQHVELGVGKKKQELSRSCLTLFYLSIYVWLLCVIFSLNGIAIANCCFAVIGNCSYSERFCNNFTFETPKQDTIIPCVLRQSEHLPGVPKNARRLI